VSGQQRKVVIALDSFTSAITIELSGTHPAVIDGAIRQGTRLYADDPIVLAAPHLFADASLLPPCNDPSPGAAEPATVPAPPANEDSTLDDVPASVPPLTREAVEARQAELKAAGAKHYGYGTLAKEFAPTSTGTIRRLLGKTR
jgi:hypothetical protein